MIIVAGKILLYILTRIDELMIRIALFLIIILTSNIASAVREITINEGHVDPMPVAVNFFSHEGNNSSEISNKITSVIENDIRSCSFFRILPAASFIENKIGVRHRPLFASWRQINAQILLNGHIAVRGDKLEISFVIWDPTLEKDIHKEILELPLSLWRRGAHKIADTIYERITGDKGYFDTRIAYISESGSPLKRVKRVAVMDFDGENNKFLTDGKNLVLTPRFSPKADKLLYISYIKQKLRIHLKDMKSGRDSIIGDFKGISFAPKFSPDGTKALLSASKNGATNIFEIDLRSKKVRQITSGFSINTSPSYSPDGSKIVFNSDRSGSGQLYIMDLDGSNVERISFGGGTYGAPVWSPKGDYIAFTVIRGGFSIGVMKTDGSGERLIANGYMVEGPTWSPSGRMIMFTRERKQNGNYINLSKIYYIDISGNNERMVKTPQDASDPEWSALLD